MPRFFSIAPALGVLVFVAFTQWTRGIDVASLPTRSAPVEAVLGDLARGAMTQTSVTFGATVPNAQRMAALALVAEVEAYWEREAGVIIPNLQVAIGLDFEQDLAPLYAEWERTSVSESIKTWRRTEWAGYTSYWYERVEGDGDADEDDWAVSRHVYAHAPAAAWRDVTDPESPLRTILIHEYFHQVQDRLNRASSAGGVPDWILEGSARYAEYRHLTAVGADTRQQESRLARPGNTSLADLQTCDVGECHQSELYWTGAAAVGWLNDRTRPSAYVDFWRESGRTGDWREAFERTYGMAIETFYQQFDEFRARQRLARTVALSGVLMVDGHPPPPGKWVVQACYTNMIQDCVASPVNADGGYDLRVAPRWLHGRETESVTITASARVGCTIFPLAPTSVGTSASAEGAMDLPLGGGTGRRDFQIKSDNVRCLTRG